MRGARAQKSHAGIGEDNGERADKVVALYTHPVETAKTKSSDKNRRKYRRSPIGIETGSICLSVRQLQKTSHYSHKYDSLKAVRLSQEAGSARRESLFSKPVPNNVQACSLNILDGG